MESTLSLQLSDLAAEVGQYLGFGRTAAKWTGWQDLWPYVPATPDTQLGRIMACVQAGVRQFYFPKMTEDQKPVAYQWSFLTPERTLTTATSQATYDLPDDFGGMDGEMTYRSTDSTWITIRRVGIGRIQRSLQTLFGATNKPSECAVYPKDTDGVTGQRFAITFAPTPDGVYTLTYRSNVLPRALSATNPFPYGGAAHAETILESCLAVAESRLNDEPGNHAARFTELLSASIAVDQRDFKPEYLGYNADRSDRRGVFGWNPWGDRWGGQTPTTYNGIQY